MRVYYTFQMSEQRVGGCSFLTYEQEAAASGRSSGFDS
ncbi:hypothetical protein KNP414_03625 [Paenibacillus mucilaginosus KNP414]|uniref:Uncharacterized protein n=1 Tax=Paenibacillus mucilaginosus (strain KNP414) TaxID=1036673 RepID=F8FDJ9_PAEMK|nr:hypothetical protein KNP414_03625 [Paenibacillus mucilaginosus KNP414]